MNDAPEEKPTADTAADARASAAPAPPPAGADEAAATAASQSAPTETAGGIGTDATRADVERFRDQWMRTAADFDNFRKRARREVEDAKRIGKEDILRELLPTFDNLERAIASSLRAADVKAVADGLGMVMKQFVDTLGRMGISKVPGVGTPFDPAVHEAIQQIETRDHPPGVVIAEVQPGYVQGERLVRAAMVVVSRTPAGDAGAGDPGAGGDGRAGETTN